jgi:F-type H+-transporting ATPase subunit gamma
VSDAGNFGIFSLSFWPDEHCSISVQKNKERIRRGSFAGQIFSGSTWTRRALEATRFVNTLTQQPIAVDYLPVGEIKQLKIPGVHLKEEFADDVGVLFEPSKEDVLNFLLTRYVNIFMYQVLLEAKASEQSARMVSMKNATDSAEGLIRDLTLEYNKFRQTNITQEMLEIAGGAAD